MSRIILKNSQQRWVENNSADGNSGPSWIGNGGVDKTIEYIFYTTGWAMLVYVIVNI